MPLYDFVCTCGIRFELLVATWRSPHPVCPGCGAPTSRRPPSPAVHGRARPPTSMSDAPQSWEGVGGGDRELITKWRREMDRRHEFEERNPEHAERRAAVAAHEGAFEQRPLTYKELATRAATSKDATTAAVEASLDRAGAETAPP